MGSSLYIANDSDTRASEAVSQLSMLWKAMDLKPANITLGTTFHARKQKHQT